MDNYDNYNNQNPENSNQNPDNHSDGGNNNNSNNTGSNNANSNNDGNNNGSNSYGNNNGYNNNNNNNNSNNSNNNGYNNNNYNYGGQPYNQGAPGPNYNPYPPQPPYKQQNNMALASMIVGIFSLLSCCFPPLQFVLGIVGILLVIFSKKGKPWSGFAIAGLVMSIISLLISIVMVLYLAFAFQMMRDPQFAPLFNEVYEMYETLPVQ